MNRRALFQAALAAPLAAVVGPGPVAVVRYRFRTSWQPGVFTFIQEQLDARGLVLCTSVEQLVARKGAQ